MNWDFLIDEDAIASVLPGQYARFALPIRDGLTVFLEGLREEHQAAILSDQASLSPSASISRRLATLAQSCPVLHKLGQVLARDQRLAPELRHHLRELESLVPIVPYETVEGILKGELGPLDRLGVELQRPALAEASVAVVVPFQFDGEGRHLPKHGVFKVLKPGIEQRLEHELDLLETVGAHLDGRCEELDIPHLDYQESFQQVRDKLAFEIRLDEEQEHLRQAREFYATEHRVQIPRLYDFCTPRVTAMERVSGGKVTDHRVEGRKAVRKVAELVVSTLITRPIFSNAELALFHSDPHAGNLFLTDDGRLAVLDWSLVGWLDEQQRTAVVQIMLGALTLNADRIVSELAGFAERHSVDRPRLQAIVQTGLRRIRQGQFPGFSWLVQMLDDAVQNARLRVPADLMLFRKTLHTLEGVIADIGADGFEIDDVLCREFLKHFAAEWPSRWLSLPNSRDFSTRLSNLDLTQTALDTPMTVARFWMGHSLDVLNKFRATEGDTSTKRERVD